MRSAAGWAPNARRSQLPRVVTGLSALVLMLLACTTQGSPATTPATAETAPYPVTTRAETTTTVDRLAEVEAIVLELEERRLDALYREDLEALRDVFASEALYERTIPIVGELEFQDPPWDIQVEVLAILVDRADCLAIRAKFDVTGALGPEAKSEEILVLTKVGNDLGRWGFAYSGGEWLCDGRNPLELEQ